MKISRDVKIAVLGFGLEGKDVVKYLLDHGFLDITVFDKKDKSQLDLKGIDTSKVKFMTGSDYLKNGLCNYKTIFRSPGIYRYTPEITKAEESGCDIKSNIILFFERFSGLTIGVTGTKGKGTTSTLIYQILKNAGKKVFLTGNIGSPPLSILDSTDKDSIVVLELSSFQLIDLKISPNIAVVLNITTDHLDWHKNQEEYLVAKRNIILHQKKADFKVINSDFESSRSFRNLSQSKNYFFSRKKKVKGVYVKNGYIYSNLKGKDLKIGDTDKLLLRGQHNWENVCAAICASQLTGGNVEVVMKTVFSFKGLEHRLELVGNSRGINYYNDSFSTNPQTTIAAVDSFNEPITLILGGYDKGLNFDEMIKHLCTKKNLPNIILIGNVENKLYGLLIKNAFTGKIYRMAESEMVKIVRKSKKITHTGGVVLLSPACASFDMFKDYKDRGDQFKRAVGHL
jgi:UDP-N-acetylmuramoylalanine--D-glutamate ligase